MRLLALLALLCGVLVPVPANAADVPGVYETPRCAGAPTWSIRYHLYWSSSTGKTLDRSQRQLALDSAKSFVEQVGELSQCAVRVRLEVVDEAGPYSEAVRQLTPGYDADFYRYPKQGDEGFSGQTQGRTAVFPVPSGWDWEPNALLLMHEWLHMVVNFYIPPVGWPREDFIRALFEYKTNVRSHPVMQMITSNLGDEEVAALAAYFNRLGAN